MGSSACVCVCASVPSLNIEPEAEFSTGSSLTHMQSVCTEHPGLQLQLAQSKNRNCQMVSIATMERLQDVTRWKFNTFYKSFTGGLKHVHEAGA